MLNVAIPVVIYFVGLVFASGGGWFALKEVRRQVNGVGKKLNDAIDRDCNRNAAVNLAIMSLAATAEQKSIVAKCLGENH